MTRVSRRRLLGWSAGSLAAVGMAAMDRIAGKAWAQDTSQTVGQATTHRPDSFLKTRGVVVLGTDLESLPEWPRMASQAGLTTLGVGPASIQGHLSTFLKTDRGRKFLAECKQLGVAVEHELHTVGELLPRELFDKDPSMFRMNDKGERDRQYNCCVSRESGLDVICENAVKYASQLVSTTGRYFFWIDDAQQMYRCPKCRPYSDSDQILIMENRVVRALRKQNPRASLAHLAYVNTLDAPIQVKPEPGVFLEFAPIQRSYAEPLSKGSARQDDKTTITHGQIIEKLDANLAVFSRDSAQVLEYWMDVSRFSNWKRPAVRLPWNSEVFHDDLRTYVRRGIRHITCYAAWIDADYIRLHGQPPLKEYADALKEVTDV